MNDLNLSFVTRTPKSFQIHFTSNCFNCFTAKVVSVFVFLSAGDTCLYAPILATCQSPPVASPCNQTQYQKCRHSRNTKKKKYMSRTSVHPTMTSLLLDRVYPSQRNLSSTSRRLEGSTIRGILKIFCRMYWRKPKTPSIYIFVATNDESASVHYQTTYIWKFLGLLPAEQNFAPIWSLEIALKHCLVSQVFEIPGFLDTFTWSCTK